MKVHHAASRRNSPARKNPGGSAATKKPHKLSRLGWIVLLIAAGVGIAGLVWWGRDIDVAALQAQAMRLNGGVAFALLTLLPLVGFPVGVLYVTVGLRFGFVAGMTLVALSVLIQLLLSYGIVNLWRDSFARRLAKVRRRIPQAAHGTVCLFTLLLPGVPYFLKNYTLVLIGVPFRIFLSWCLPVHVLRAVVTVGLGEQTGRHTPAGLAALGAYWALTLGASWWTYRRLRRQLADPPPAADGRKRPA